MSFVSYISNAIIPIIVLLIVTYSLIEKNKVYDVFLEGAKDGMKIVFNIFPTLVGIFVAVGALRSSGLIDGIIFLVRPVMELFKVPIEILPLAVIRPISGSASMAIATEIMSMYGTDSLIGKIASTIMGSTETTLYTIAIYTSCVGIKKIRFVLCAALIADFVGMAAAVIICRIMS